MNKLIRQLIQPTEGLLNLKFRYEQKCEVFNKTPPNFQAVLVDHPLRQQLKSSRLFL